MKIIKIKFYSFVFIGLSTSLFGKFYSEDKQDEYVYKSYFKNKKKGFFIDIGAHNGIHNSNSYFFELLGWDGICFEPDPRTYKQLLKNRRCKLYNYAVGSENRVEKFIQHPCTFVSGLDRTYCDEHRKCWNVPHGIAQKYFIDVEVVNLNTILSGLNVTYIDFLSIDTEGAEKDILSSIDFDRFYIKVIVVENKYHDVSIKNHLINKGYKMVKRLHRDEVYVRETKGG